MSKLIASQHAPLARLWWCHGNELRFRELDFEPTDLLDLAAPLAASGAVKLAEPAIGVEVAGYLTAVWTARVVYALNAQQDALAVARSHTLTHEGCAIERLTLRTGGLDVYYLETAGNPYDRCGYRVALDWGQPWHERRQLAVAWGRVPPFGALGKQAEDADEESSTLFLSGPQGTLGSRVVDGHTRYEWSATGGAKQALPAEVRDVRAVLKGARDTYLAAFAFSTLTLFSTRTGGTSFQFQARGNIEGAELVGERLFVLVADEGPIEVPGFTARGDAAGR